MGDKETLELVQTLMQATLILVDELADGAEAADAGRIFARLQSPEVGLVAAIQGIENVPAELKDLDAAEGIEIVMKVVSYVPQLLMAITAARARKAVSA